MPDIKSRIPRTAMSAQERRWRSRLAQLISEHRFVRGSLQERYRVCGKSNCRCATKGKKHRAVYLVFSRDGNFQQLYVPKQWEATVRQWVENYHDVRDLLEKISEHYLNQVEKRQG